MMASGDEAFGRSLELDEATQVDPCDGARGFIRKGSSLSAVGGPSKKAANCKAGRGLFPRTEAIAP